MEMDIPQASSIWLISHRGKEEEEDQKRDGEAQSPESPVSAPEMPEQAPPLLA
jgi:hypothetical protein